MTASVQAHSAPKPTINFGCAEPRFSAKADQSQVSQAQGFHQCVTFGCCGGDRLEKKFQAP